MHSQRNSNSKKSDALYVELATVVSPWEAVPNEENEENAPPLKTVEILRQYLVKELCRAEHLESQLNKCEATIVTVCAERDEMLKKIAAHKRIQNNNKRERSGKNHQVAHNNIASNFIGCYVRKLFDGKHYFGVIAGWNAPWYTVVYEDSDAEELTLSVVKRLLWKNLVPTAKTRACRSHARNMGHPIEEEERKQVE